MDDGTDSELVYINDEDQNVEEERATVLEEEADDAAAVFVLEAELPSTTVEVVAVLQFVADTEIVNVGYIVVDEVGAPVAVIVVVVILG